MVSRIDFAALLLIAGMKPTKNLPWRSFRSPRPKRKAQEIKLLLRIFSSPIIILTVNNLRLLQVKFQPTFRKSPFNRHPKSFRFGFAPTVTNPIIGISLEWNLRILSLHPRIERIMQKEIRKQGTDHPSLRSPFIPMNQAAIFQLHRGFQPSLDVEKHPFAIGMFPYRPHQKIMVDIVKEALDVEVQEPSRIASTADVQPLRPQSQTSLADTHRSPDGNTLPRSAPGIA